MRSDFRTGVLLLVVLLTVLGSLDAASAQGSGPTEDEVNQVARELYCPVCENIPLDACGTTACEQWRGVIREKLAQGWTAEEIKAYFVSQYGDRVLAEPPARGFNWLVYLVPPLAFAAGLVILFMGYQRWHREEIPEAGMISSDAEIRDQPPSAEYLRKVEEELERRRHG